jgi:NAD+ synthase (glutamine-hydrolysing)
MRSAKYRYCLDPQQILGDEGADIFINISASPYSLNKENLRYQIFRHHATKYGIPFIYVNQVGAKDELIFDGRSMAINAKGEIMQQLPAFEEAVVTIETVDKSQGQMGPDTQMESLYKSLTLGIRDYFKKTGFSRAIIGLSGRIDSALTAVLAVEALGRENVLGISMPSPYSSEGSVTDSRVLAQNLGIELETIPLHLFIIPICKVLRIILLEGSPIKQRKIFRLGYAEIRLWHFLTNREGRYCQPGTRASWR